MGRDSETGWNIAGPLYQTAQTVPDHPAVVVGKATLSYAELARSASALARVLRPRLVTRRVGILATRSLAAYQGIAGAAWAGATYVPLNLKWPAERLVALMKELALDALVVDRNGARLLDRAVLEAAPKLIIASDDAAAVPGALRIGELEDRGIEAPAPMPAEHSAYIMFTSGSTGLPKGVVVSCGSLAAYLHETRKWAGFTTADRVAEAHDVTFDLSVHNMFLAFEAGATLHIMSTLDMMAPQRFVRSNEITAWMSVPTIVAMMRANGLLKDGLFPSLRLSVFCGEPLPIPAVEAWARAAPNSVVENIYGPTECTVVCMRQRLTDPPVATPKRNILAIGRPYDNFRVALLDGDQKPVPRGEIGEIALSSAQLSDGYFGKPELTADRFRLIDGERWYLTGDLGVEDENGVFHHMGRADNQIKLKGNRIELEEVEMHLRRAAGTDLASVVAWPIVDGSAQGLVAFVAGKDGDGAALQQAMMQSLPRYMVPQRVVFAERLPQNANGKTDRRALAAWLDTDSAKGDAEASPQAVVA